MGDSNVTRLAIVFDRENQTYIPGELVSGKVLAEFSKSKKVRGVKIVVSGKAVVRWSEQSGRRDKNGHRHQETYSGREEYFTTEFYLLGSASGSTIELPAGELSYTFNIQMPMDLPSSFEHNHGHVRYTVKAIFDRPWKFDLEVKTAFTIISTYDLNHKPQASLSIKEIAENKFYCFCICTGKMSATISAPISGFVPGQTILVTVQCENQSNVEVEEVKVSLRQKLRFYASSPRWNAKEYQVTVLKAKRMNLFPEKAGDPVTMGLKVPSLPPSSLEFCGIIDLDYVLRVVFRFSGMHYSFEREFPIFIGTVPLCNTYYTYNPGVVTMPSPNAPQLQQPHSMGMPFPGVPPQDSSSQPALGFVIPNPPYLGHVDPNHLPPPTYEQSVYGTQSIIDNEESEYVYGARVPFAPRYPVYNYDPPNSVPDKPVSGKQ